MSRQFNLSFKAHASSNTALHIKGSNRHNRLERDELPMLEKFPKGSHAARRQRREERFFEEDQ
jgi:hypothetical protein